MSFPEIFLFLEKTFFPGKFFHIVKISHTNKGIIMHLMRENSDTNCPSFSILAHGKTYFLNLSHTLCTKVFHMNKSINLPYPPAAVPLSPTKHSSIHLCQHTVKPLPAREQTLLLYNVLHYASYLQRILPHAQINMMYTSLYTYNKIIS